MLYFTMGLSFIPNIKTSVFNILYKFKLSQLKKLGLRQAYVKKRYSDQVMFLSNEQCRLLIGRTVLLLDLTAIRTLVRRSYHLSYLGGPKSPSHAFFVLVNSGRFGLGKFMFKQKTTYVCGRQTSILYTQTIRQAVR